MHLERLARTYWKYLSRVTLGLIRVEYTDTERAVVLLHRPLVLLRFNAPEYKMRRRPRDRALDDPRRHPRRPPGPHERRLPGDRRQALPGRRAGHEKVHVEVEVANFYPALATLGGALVLRQHPVAHPRARHARLPALAGAAGARGVGRRALRPHGQRAGAPARRRAAGQRRRHAVAGVGRHRRRRHGASASCTCASAPAGRRAGASRSGSPASARSLPRSWRDWIRRTVPERLRMTSDSVEAPAPLVADALEHVAVGHAGGREEALSPLTRSSWVSTRSRS